MVQEAQQDAEEAPEDEKPEVNGVSGKDVFSTFQVGQTV